MFQKINDRIVLFLLCYHINLSREYESRLSLFKLININDILFYNRRNREIKTDKENKDDNIHKREGQEKLACNDGRSKYAEY